MKTVFADTSFYLAAANPGDEAHEESASYARGYTGAIVTTEYVLVEVANRLSRSGDREVFIGLLDDLEQDRGSRVIPASTELFRHGIGLYRSRPDKEWSLTDCISFVVMEENGLREALTTDHHFEQAGFVSLLK